MKKKIIITGGGPLVKVSEEMINKLAAPSGKLYRKQNCVTCTLYFLGIFGNPLKKLLNSLEKNRGLTLTHITNMIREYENSIRKSNQKENLILEDRGRTEYARYRIPDGPLTNQDINKLYLSLFTKIYENIPYGFATIVLYERANGLNHAIVIIRGAKGSYNILDIQSDIFIRSHDGSEIITFLKNQNIVAFCVFENGLVLNIVKSPRTGIPGHSRRNISKKTRDGLSRQLSFTQ